MHVALWCLTLLIFTANWDLLFQSSTVGGSMSGFRHTSTYLMSLSVPAAVMTREVVLMVCLALVLLVCSRGGEARVRLNSIRTVILREGHALPVNRSTWEPSLDLTVSVCLFLPVRSRTVWCSVRHISLSPLCSCTSAWATWSAARGATATPPPKAPPTHAVRPAAGGRGVAIGTACVARATAAATVRIPENCYSVYKCLFCSVVRKINEMLVKIQMWTLSYLTVS